VDWTAMLGAAVTFVWRQRRQMTPKHFKTIF
jgi:hypothetical protein